MNEQHERGRGACVPRHDGKADRRTGSVAAVRRAAPSPPSSRPGAWRRSGAARLPRTILAMVLLLVPVACAGGGGFARPPIILIVVDTLRADHLGVYGYERATSPEIDARAASGAVFESAYSTSPWTLPAFGSLYTGRIPTRHGAGVIVQGAAQLPSREELDRVVRRGDDRFVALDPGLPTLAGLLREAGYATGAVINNPFLDPKFGVARGFDDYDLEGRVGPRERHADAAVDRALEWIDGRRRGRPFFLVLHVIDPHMPYTAPEPFRGSFAADELDGIEPPETLDDFFDLREEIRGETGLAEGAERADRAERAMALHTAAYDEEIAFVDAQLGRLFAGLDERGLWEASVVALTSDHGEELHDHGWFEHGHSVHDEVVRVPLIVWGSDVRPGRVEDPASLVDVMPTLLEPAGIDPPAEVAGVSLWPALRFRTVLPPRLLFAERTLYGPEEKAVWGFPMKAILDVDSGRRRLFDLAADPGETEDLAALHEDRLLALLGELRNTMLEADRLSDAEEVILDEETLDRLRALGYIR